MTTICDSDSYEKFSDTFEKVKALTEFKTFQALAIGLNVPPDTIRINKNKNIFPNEWLYQLCSSQSIPIEFFIQSDIELRNIDPDAHLDHHLEETERVKSGFARRLKKARQDKGYTHRQLGIKTKLAFQWLSNLESPKRTPYNPSAYLVNKLATALDIPASYLRTGKRFYYKNSDKVVPFRTVNLKDQWGRGGIGRTKEQAIINMKAPYNPTAYEMMEDARLDAGHNIRMLREDADKEKKKISANAKKANMKVERETQKKIESINHKLKEWEAEQSTENPTQAKLFATI